MGSAGIVRCKRCRTYINPFVTWTDGGRCGPPCTSNCSHAENQRGRGRAGTLLWRSIDPLHEAGIVGLLFVALSSYTCGPWTAVMSSLCSGVRHPVTAVYAQV
jgi:Sec23/Sec24 zinc finger